MEPKLTAPTNRQRAGRTPRFREIAAAIKAERRLIAAYLRKLALERGWDGPLAIVNLDDFDKGISNGAHYDIPTS